RFRHAAVRSLFIPRSYQGQRTPADLMRLKADALLEAVGGVPDFPVVAETLRECFEDALDVPRLKRMLERLHDGEMWTRHVDTPLPSPFVYPLLLAWDWAYLDAGHAEERRSDAVSMRKAWSVSAGPLRPEIVAGVGAELQKMAPDRRARAGRRRLGGAALRPLARGGDGHAGAAHRARPRASRRVPGGRAGPPVRPHRSAGGGPAPSGARAPPAASRGDRRAVLGDAAAAASPASRASPRRSDGRARCRRAAAGRGLPRTRVGAGSAGP